MRKRFSYLVVIAIISIVLVAAAMVLTMVSKIPTLQYEPIVAVIAKLLLIEALLFVLLSHSITILVFQRKYYPSKEIPKTTRTYFTILSVICWLLVALAVIMFFIALSDMALSAIGMWDVLGMGIFLLPVILFIVQLVGGGRLVETIQQNARDQLMNSF